MYQKCGIIVPVHRTSLLEFEVISLRQCCKMLVNYQIIIITYETLILDEYIKIFEEYKVKYKIEYFPIRYFSGITGYSALMLSGKFYKRFLNFEYILIYQLDAYVFSSNLNYWLEKGYDYIGGPFFREIQHTLKLQWSGFFNGGLCLRRTNVFYRLSFKKNIKLNMFFLELNEKIKRKNMFFVKIYFKILRRILKIFIKNMKITSGIESEDFIWSKIIQQEGSMAPFDIALAFSFDNYYEHSFNVNKDKLPFGCHGWDTVYSYKFIQKYIKETIY
jgi:hypothetical protein